MPMLILAPDLAIADRPGWHEDAACRNRPDVDFFADSGPEAAPAKAVCARCPVRADCLAFALRNDERHGVWGGLSPRQRRAFTPRIAS